MPHRPLQEMFSKTALVISTTAGTGTKHVIKPIERSLRYWGIPKVYIPVKTKILFRIFRKLMNSYPDGNQDKEYWRDKGWLQGKKPW